VLHCSQNDDDDDDDDDNDDDDNPSLQPPVEPWRLVYPLCVHVTACNQISD